MEIIKKLCHGVNEETPKDFLYPQKITIANYKEPEKVKIFMEIMSNFKIYQYNYNNSLDSDYFFWQYVDDNGVKNWQSVDLCRYQNNVESVAYMWNLKNICETTYTNLQAIIYYDDIRNLIEKIEKEVV